MRGEGTENIEAYEIRHISVALKFIAGIPSRLGAGVWVGNAPCATDDFTVEGYDAGSLEELGRV